MGVERFHVERLRTHLRTQADQMPTAHWIARDPIRFPRRYRDPRDIEIAGLLAAQLAFGRVELFGPVIDTILAIADRHGGPAEWVRRGNVLAEPDLQPIYYRWVRGPDLARFAPALGRLLREHGSLEAVFAVRAGEADCGPALIRGVGAVRDALPGARTRGVQALIASPADGSACKRWNLWMRWMARPGPIDLGIWTAVPTRSLVLPLDTHTARIGRLLGLTDRKTDGWKTAVDITDALRRLDPEDPVRYDFQLAHLGISGKCKARWEPEICPGCALRPVCRVGAGTATA